MKIELNKSIVTIDMRENNEKEIKESKKYKRDSTIDTIIIIGILVYAFFLFSLIGKTQNQILCILCSIPIVVAFVYVLCPKFRPTYEKQLTKLHNLKQIIYLQDELLELKELNLTGHMIFGLDKDNDVDEHAMDEEMLDTYLKDGVLRFDLITEKDFEVN